jgi:hypothetical protein
MFARRPKAIIVAMVLITNLAATTQVTGQEKDATKTATPIWGKEVSGLALSIAPAEAEKGKFILRWKNAGQEPLEVPWVRFGSNAIYKNLDDLQNHVYLKGEGGKLVPARQYKFPIIGGPPYRPRTVILDPGGAHQETIDLWTYLEKPVAQGRYELWVDLDIKSAFAPSRKGAKYWTGKIESNVLEVKVSTSPLKLEVATQEGKDRVKNEPPGLDRRLIDHLPLLDVKDKTKLNEEQRELLKKLEKSKVPTQEKAKAIATEHKFRASGILAEEAPHVVSLLPLGIDVPDLGKRGDLIWIVQFRVFRGAITQEIWVSASTGAAMAMVPMKR